MVRWKRLRLSNDVSGSTDGSLKKHRALAPAAPGILDLLVAASRTLHTRKSTMPGAAGAGVDDDDPIVGAAASHEANACFRRGFRRRCRVREKLVPEVPFGRN